MGEAMNEKRQYLEKGRHGTPLFPVEYYNCVYPAGLAGLPVHWHEEFEITYVKKGKCIYLIDLTPMEVREGDFLFLPSGMLHGIPEGKTKMLETDSFVFHPSMLGEKTDVCGVRYIAPLEHGEISFPPVLHEQDWRELSAGLQKVFSRLKKAFLEQKTGFEMEVKVCLTEFILLLYQTAPYERRKKENTDILEKLRSVLLYIKENYSATLTISELAGVCHFSEYYFMRFFKQYMNMTCIEYINQYRMEIAAGKLAEGEENITDIAFDVGFRNISYFNRVFKNSFGMTPKAYRKALSRQEESRQETGL